MEMYQAYGRFFGECREAADHIANPLYKRLPVVLLNLRILLPQLIRKLFYGFSNDY